MTKTQKPVSINVMHILKGIMDFKAQPLHTAVDAANRAKQEESEIYAHITSLQRFISNNRYDPRETREAENDLADYEDQAAGIRQKIASGNTAEKQLIWINKFYSTYHSAVNIANNHTKIALLENEYHIIESKLDRLEDRIFSCEINLSPSERNSDVVSQSESDLEKYRNEYNVLSEKLRTIHAQINQLKK